ncbi:MAG: 4-formylbenzenesulfonate dehydrogenase TsaC1/TsaC2 [Alphaproteobacteria bacterium MarineAlpha4_Bin2]|mgnify:CR=1 FL=1|nr:MAG: 4-formylbenzenesulfonate dehydrogenase TsaC1/TsaC2 [Alphaproteobacteria bacterium MarineAlpha4_Bin2]
MPKTPEYFADKTIVISGAGSGIGRATAQIFAREGANVVCGDIDVEAAERTANQIIQKGGKALGVACDVTKREPLIDTIRRAVDEYGRVNFQFNCAGAAGRRAAFLEIDEDLWDSTFDVNTKSIYYSMQAVLPHMLEKGGGVIVNVASMSHKRGGPGTSIHYAASKGAVVTMTLGVAREFADRGIRCLSISPGPVRTAFQEAANTPPELMERFKNDVPMKRFAEPEEIGELVLFMCSDACEYMTADTVYVNGGGGWR